MLWLYLLACQPAAVYCDGPTAHVYDPLVSDRLDAWPDDIFTVADPSTPTDSRLDLAPHPWFQALPDLVGDIASAVDGASGFGTQAELHVRFSGELGAIPTVAESTTSSAVQLWNVDTLERVPFEARLGTANRQLLLMPVGPLAPNTRHALIVTTAQTDSEGRCMAPSPVLRAVLDRDSTGVWVDRERPTKQLLADLEIVRDDVTALLTFTTHADHVDFLRAADEAREAEQQWADSWTCTQAEGHRVCQTQFDPIDFRGPNQLVLPGSTTRQPVDVTFWLPDGVTNPPMVVYAHGLGQNRGDGDELAELLMPLGIAMAGTDALFHGDHPSANGNPDPLAFLGLDLSAGLSFDLERMRSSFDQSTLDRRQLVTLLSEVPDVDGDGTREYDPDRLGYLGISLGGIMGSGLLAVSDDLDVAVLAIAGGNLVSIVRDTEAVSVFLPLIVQLAGGQEQFEATFSLLQTAIDPSDPVLFGANVLDRRLNDGAPPHVLLPVATLDEVVPFSAGRALARAYKLPHVGPVSLEVPGLEVLATPVSQNGPEGVTAGYFQYDRMTRSGELMPSEHIMPRSEEFAVQLTHFFDTWATTGTPEIIDPFEALGTPPLP